MRCDHDPRTHAPDRSRGARRRPDRRRHFLGAALSEQAAQAGAAVHPRLPERRAGAAGRALSGCTARAAGRGRQSARRRHHDRGEGRPRIGAGRPHPAVHEHAHARHRSAAQQELHLRSDRRLRAGGGDRQHVPRAGGLTIGSRRHGAGAGPTRQGQPGHVEHRLRTGNAAASGERVVQDGDRCRHRQHSLPRRCTGHHRSARRTHPHESRVPR